ncbi:MAG: AbrB/MazE/SpoVT family DNA-binding domain-containing protein [Firmicutes bacterium]|nr:AbrB/MazE/SpoVT family DNA-binding domain-containing protein [Bacillota bacterium]
MERQITKVTAKGQVTIPANLRKALRIHSGDYLSVFREGNRLVAEVVEGKEVKGGVIEQTAGIWKDRDLDLKDLRHSDDTRFGRLGIE